MDESVNVFAKSAVVPPEAKSSFYSTGDAPLTVTIEAVNQNEGDDCRFVLCRYPDGFVKNHQLFLNKSTDDLFPILIQTFRYRYGKNVIPVSKLGSTFEQIVGKTINFEVQ